MKDKVMIIMRGLPGSGKSTRAKALGEGGVVLASDDFFMVRGEYRYDKSAIGYAHQWNQRRSKEAMRRGVSPVVVDNTNVKSEHTKPYVDAAKEHGYEVVFEEPDSPWWKKWFGPDMTPDEMDSLVKELMSHGTHDVPEDVVRTMLSEWEHDMPSKLTSEKRATWIIDARRVLAYAQEGDEAPGQALPEEDKERNLVQQSEPAQKVKKLPVGQVPIQPPETRKKSVETLRPMLGPLAGDSRVQNELNRPATYQLFKEMIERGTLGPGAGRVQRKMMNEEDFHKAFPPLKNNPWGRKQAPQEAPSPADSRPKGGKTGPGSKSISPATTSPTMTPKAGSERPVKTAAEVIGDEPRIFSDIPGVEGHVNLTIGIQRVFDAMKSVFPPDTFHVNGKPMMVQVGSLTGKFGEARYDPSDQTQQSTIHIDLDNIIGAVHKAVENEAIKTQQTGAKVQITDDIARRINQRIAELIWETIGHEAGHLRDYQSILKRMQETGQGSLNEAMESVGERAGKDALGRFKEDTW